MGRMNQTPILWLVCLPINAVAHAALNFLPIRPLSLFLFVRLHFRAFIIYDAFAHVGGARAVAK